MRRLPVVPTLLVLIAIGIMLRLGFWQLDRLHEKNALLARYTVSQAMSADVPWPGDAAGRTANLYRHSRFDCANVTGVSPIAGRNAKGESGIVHVAHCILSDGTMADAVLGWSIDPTLRSWNGGEVAGIIAPSGKGSAKLVLDQPQAGLAANRAPDPGDIPNNHLSYAVQWFLFAGTALIIYVVAVRKRLAARGSGG